MHRATFLAGQRQVRFQYKHEAQASEPLRASSCSVHSLALRACIGALGTLLCPPSLAIADPTAESSLAIEHVTVVDVVKGALLADQTILTEGATIRAVSASTEAQVPEHATRVDGQGLFAIPGLWDMHIHWYGQDSMKLFPINGVTGVRVMWGSFMHHAWRQQFDSGERLGPRMIIASAIIDGPEPIWPGSIIAEDSDGGRRAVETAIKAKSDFAKVYSLLSREAYFAIAEEAAERELPFDGHVPIAVSTEEAANAGHRCMEHLYGLLLGCSSEETALRETLGELIEQEGGVRQALGSDVTRDINRRALATVSTEKAKALFEVFRQQGTWHCPTLTVLRNMAYLTEPEVRENPNLKYMPKSMLPFLTPKTDRFGDDEAARDFARAKLKKERELLKQMHDSGVRLVAGTDVLNPYCLPGFSLHGELQLLVESGLKPIDALRTATINPAIFQGKERELGAIETGKAADIVLLRANPLEDIRSTAEIEHVVLRGQLHRRDELDALLEDFAEANE